MTRTKKVWLAIVGIAYVTGILAFFVVAQEGMAAAFFAAPGSYVVLGLSEFLGHHSRVGIFLDSWNGNFLLLLLSVTLNVVAVGILLRLRSRRRGASREA